jgi:alpha-1,4-glucan branching enzyme GlgB, N-terminal domain
MSSLTPEAYAVIEGRHSDPFRYLGPHVENGSSVVRVFLPDAEGVALVDEQGHESDLQRIHDAGLFEGRLRNGPRHYRLRARYGERQVEIEDPYRFPPILSDLDLYLLGEGARARQWLLGNFRARNRSRGQVLLSMLKRSGAKVSASSAVSTAYRRCVRLAGRDDAGQFPHRCLGEPAALYRAPAARLGIAVERSSASSACGLGRVLRRLARPARRQYGYLLCGAQSHQRHVHAIPAPWPLKIVM